MTLLQLINEVKRILAYDGQLADAGASVNDIIRDRITEATFWWVRAVRSPIRVVSTNISVGQAEVNLESTANAVLVERAWWQTADGSRTRLVRVLNDSELDDDYLFGTTVSPPSFYSSYGGFVRLYPIPSASGTLVCEAVVAKRFTSDDDNQPVTVIPISGRQAVCLMAASMYLMPYTELQPKAMQYRALAEQIAKEWRGDAIAYAHTDLTPQRLQNWEVMP